MKLTKKITDLLFVLSELESQENTQLLIGDGATLRNNLLKLYRVTDNEFSRELIADIMAEAGYPWLGKLANAPDGALFESAVVATNDDFLLSEEEFLELIPVNGHFH
ncbi:hypothetical protein [Arenicella xantha]|uniref:Uncharacterized protein n=1 Tax=Arenicella xantha TaxID=644221 RepID=A0A395JHM7_9GAMM|nr:hypothetical protein [Arenicella xantha]RBP48359.1 hypothetical protein DFR28_10888 [Arenicella xantha]